MLMICLRVLSILGTVLLGLLAAAAVFLLLVLFAPVTYRISAEKDEGGFRVSARARWLLGLVRVRCEYPDPGYLVARILLFTLYKTKIPSEEISNKDGKDESRGRQEQSGIGKDRNKSRKEKRQIKGGEFRGRAGKAESADNKGSEKECVPGKQENLGKEDGRTGALPERKAEEGTDKTTAAEDVSKEGAKTAAVGDGKILQKFQKIKYTIRSICDKIKEIWDNISYYLELLQEEPTRQFITHVRLRAGKMLKRIMPRRIRADIRFGTGSPDTTGYLYGVFCMISPRMGSSVTVTPDFEEAVLQGQFDVSGHVTSGILLWNLCRVVLDRRLRHLIRKIRFPGSKASGKKAA